MPILNIFVNRNVTPAQSNNCLNAAKRWLTALARRWPTCGIVQTVDANSTIVAGEIGKEQVQVTVYLLPGRTDEQKEAQLPPLVRAVTDSVCVPPTAA